MAVNYIKLSEWFEAIGESQGVDKLATEPQMNWDSILKQSQTLRVITRGETMTAMRVQQAKLERLTKSKLSSIVEENHNSLCRN